MCMSTQPSRTRVRAFLSRSAKAHLFALAAVPIESPAAAPVTKASPLRDDVPDFILDLIDDAAAAGLPKIRRLVLEAFDELVDGIAAGPIAESVASGSAGPIFAVVSAWEAFADKLGEIFDPDGGALLGVIERIQESSIAALPVDVVGLDMEAVAARSIAWLEREGAKQIAAITRNTRTAINKLVQDAFAGPESIQQAAKKILRSKGFTLDPRRAAAFEKYVAALLDPKGPGGDLTAKQIQRLINQKHRRMLRQRALMIAQTEAYNAGNAAQGEVWKEAVLQEHLDPALYVMEWVTRVINVCPRCQALDGTTAEITGGLFTSRPIDGGGKFNGQVIQVASPTVHPFCYCTRRIIARVDALDALPLAA